jgi:Tfp pilus assembly protein PilX
MSWDPFKPPGRRRAVYTPGRAQRGAVLIVALVLILIMSLLGAVAIRNATQSERSINGIRTAEVSREGAETALRFCEQVAMFDGDGKDYAQYGTASAQLRSRIISAPVITSESDTSAAWRLAQNWIGDKPIPVPQAYYQKFNGATADDAVPQLATAPRCVIQKIQSSSTPALNGYLITARGFANNAKFEPTTGVTTQGAEAWLQSVLTRSN